MNATQIRIDSNQIKYNTKLIGEGSIKKDFI